MNKRYWWTQDNAEKFKLTNTEPLNIELKKEDSLDPIMGFGGKAIRKYLASRPPRPQLTSKGVQCKFKDGTPKPDITEQFIFDSVTDISKQIGGTGDGLLDWAVAQTLLDLLAQAIPSYDYTGHLENVRFLRHHHDLLKDEAKRKQPRGKAPNMQDMAALLMRHLVEEPKIEVSLSAFAQMLDRATDARKRSLEEAGELGTRTHELIDLMKGNGYEDGRIRYWMHGSEYEILLENEEPEVQRSFETFLTFWVGMGLRVVASELLVADPEIWVAGTLDQLVETQAGDLILCDWKTSKATRDHFLIQVAAYARMHHKASADWPVRAYIVRCDKYHPDLQVVPVYDNKTDYLNLCKQWAAQVQTHRWLKWARKHIAKFQPTDVGEEEEVEMKDQEVDEAFSFRGEEAKSGCPF